MANTVRRNLKTGEGDPRPRISWSGGRLIRPHPNRHGFWIHLDADVLDDAVMPAADYRLPGGLSPAELVAVLSAAIVTGRAVGVGVTIYNPQLDPDVAAAKVLVQVIGEAL